MKNKQAKMDEPERKLFSKGRRRFALRGFMLVCCFIFMAGFVVQAYTPVPQQGGRTVSGTVVDESGEPLIGVNIQVVGTTTGAITDIDGKFSFQAAAGNIAVQVSYVGYLTQRIAVGNQPLRIVLVEDTRNIDEVVVVGYGTQAKKDITGAVAVVSADALAETPVSTFAEALMGKAAGVYVSSSGAPGASTTIRIRGVGSMSGSDPLIIVDGIQGVNVDGVNPNDIESFQILKDASATAIYGAQGANGVIIVTTKQGSKDRVRISYNGYGGAATMANSGYNLLNGWESMEFVAQGMVNMRDVRGVTNISPHAQFGSLNANDQLTMPYAVKPAGLSEAEIISQYGSIALWEASYKSDGSNSWARSAYAQMLHDGYSEAEAREGTDWYNLVTQTGAVQDHQISAMGGNEKGQYSLSLGMNSREGTIKSSYFDRYTLRVNTSFSPSKWLTIGANINLSAMELGGERGNQGDGDIFGKVYTTASWLPVYNIGGDFAGSQAPEGGRNTSALNAAINQENDWTRNFRGDASIFAEVKPINGLTLRTQYAPRLGGTWIRTFNEVTIAADKEGSANNNLYEEARYSFDWQWTNTATYARTFNSIHQATVVVGTEALSNDLGRRITVRRLNYIFPNDPNTWNIDNGSTSNISNSGYMDNHTTMFGVFGRADYVYNNKYLATASFRYDGSSKFGSDNRFGFFPSLSLGWRMTEESFFAPVKTWLDDLKLRAGYGTTGNSNIGAYNYAFQYATGTGNSPAGSVYDYAVGGTDTNLSTGYGISNLGYPDAKWETVQSINIGLDGAIINKLTFNLDWYLRRTSDMLVPANWSAQVGTATKPSINIGDMENYGVDVNLTWRDRVGKDLRYNIGLNLSNYSNKVVRLGSSDLFYSSRIQNITITTEGQPIGMFYGYNVLGIYQNANDVTGYTTNGKTVVPYGISVLKDLNPDDFIGRAKLEDVNQDGRIDANDRTIIGNPHPDLTGGFNIGINYKNWDFSTYFVFSAGNDLYRHYMFYTHFGQLQSNYSKDRRDNSWSPSNPGGTYPLWATINGEGSETATQSNSLYIQDGSYLRSQMLTVGYSLPRSLLNKAGLERIRIYGQVGNLFTITGYDGLDPEVRSFNIISGSPDRARGVDYGSYGMPRQFIMGVNLSF